jgi:Mce-associated membrane protein
MAIDADAAGRQLTDMTSPEDDDGERPVQQGVPSFRLPIAVGLIFVMALAGLVGWLGYRANQTHHGQQQRDLFLQVGRQAAVNLTTINHTEAEADVQRILDSAVGSFHDEFQQRAPAFVEVVKQSQSKSEGTVIAAGVESEAADQAQVLVAVSVKTSTAAAPQQEPRAWRMRIDVKETGDGAKVSNVRFVA